MILLASAILVLGSASGIAPALADQPSLQPYIDQLKETLDEKPTAPGQQEPEAYIKSVKKRLQQSESKENAAGYSETLRASDPRRGEAHSADDFTAKEKNRLGPKEYKSPIEQVKQGTSSLSAKVKGTINNAISIRMGAAMKYDITAPGASHLPFSNVYGNNWTPDFFFTYEYQPFHSEWYGNIGLVLGGGLAYNSGSGVFKFNLQNPSAPGTSFGTMSRVKFQFFTLPAVVGLNYRFNLFRLVRPYVQACPALIGYSEARSDSKSGFTGMSKGVLLNGGANILLDWMFSQETSDLYDTFNVKHYYLTIDYSRLSTVQGDVKFANSGLSAGLTYEF